MPKTPVLLTYFLYFLKTFLIIYKFMTIGFSLEEQIYAKLCYYCKSFLVYLVEAIIKTGLLELFSVGVFCLKKSSSLFGLLYLVENNKIFLQKQDNTITVE